ncbi:hypothetical protein K4K57_009272 [Colletotrichum sp. SAR 10_99]|nr:hypothetical protein K4K56_005110 [Colletotrichum sp. SAR 10_98]KAJ5019809.1 hypothetical protein K4K57_009272 [Colletotrichum sp. SAR 10_99]
MFFQESSDETRSAPPPESWRLFRDRSLPVSIDAADRYREVIHEYFAEVNIFFPLLSLDDILATFNEVVSCEKSPALESDAISPARYCLLLLVLCMGSFVCTGEYRISLNEAAGRNGGQEPPSLGSGYFKEVTGLDEKLWQKARLLLGFISSEINLEAAQCSIARYEDVVPYPAPETPKHRQEHAAAFSTPETNPTSPATSTFYRTEELVAFQISTNAAIRRFLNRVNSVIYDSKDQKTYGLIMERSTATYRTFF